MSNIERNAIEQFRHKSFKEEFHGFRKFSVIFKYLLSGISIFFGAYYFEKYIFSNLFESATKSASNFIINAFNNQKDATISVFIWIISFSIVGTFEFFKHYFIPIAFNSFFRKIYLKGFLLSCIGGTGIFLSFYFTIKGADLFFDQTEQRRLQLDASFKIKEEKLKLKYDSLINKELILLQEIQDRNQSNNLISNSLERINSIDEEIKSIEMRMHNALLKTNNKDSVSAIYIPVLKERRKRRERLENEAGEQLKFALDQEKNQQEIIKSKQQEKEEQLTQLSSTKSSTLKDSIGKTTNVLQYIFIISICIESMIVICIFFIIYYNYKISKEIIEEQFLFTKIQTSKRSTHKRYKRKGSDVESTAKNQRRRI